MAAKRLTKTSAKVTSYIDLNDYGLGEVPEGRRASVKADVGNYLVSQIRRNLRSSRSPVAGEGFKTTLSEAYRRYKSSVGGGSQANLRLFGDLLNSLAHEPGPGGQVGIGHTGVGRDGRPNARKCVGHCHFERSRLPRRRYLPDRGQSYREEIEGGISEIVQRYKDIDLQAIDLQSDVVAQVFDTETLVDLFIAGEAANL